MDQLNYIIKRLLQMIPVLMVIIVLVMPKGVFGAAESIIALVRKNSGGSDSDNEDSGGSGLGEEDDSGGKKVTGDA